jgi:hypothetical protein
MCSLVSEEGGGKEHTKKRTHAYIRHQDSKVANPDPDTCTENGVLHVCIKGTSIFVIK